MARAIAPPGSTLSICVPARLSPNRWKNHQGTPFIAATTTISGPRSGFICAAASRSAGALTASTTRSWTPSLAASHSTFTEAWSLSPLEMSVRPFDLRASKVFPRAMTFIETPDLARRAPIQPPMAPAPKTVTFILISQPMVSISKDCSTLRSKHLRA
ncbi:hypothetical protein D3C87_1611900 [compost metagenome]